MIGANVWLVEDDPNLRRILSTVLREGGYRSREFQNAEESMRAIELEIPDLILTDLQMPGMDGIELLRWLKKRAPEIPVILLTAHGTIDRAVEAMKSQAYDFLTKPVSNDKLLIVVRNALEQSFLRTEVRQLRQRRTEDLGATIVGESDQIQQVRTLIEKVSPQQTTVLVTGETGTGKEVVARAIHAASPRAPHLFLPVNCGAIPEGLVESELFGHKRGAFTGALRDRRGFFATAHHGTLFLDEIGDLPLAAQAKLLRVLEDHVVTPVGSAEEIEVDVRVIAATNRNLKTKEFREDLYYRLDVFPIRVPTLRERKGDIPLLVAHLLKRKTDDPPEISPEALALLMDHSWPGNVRELDNVLERALVLAAEETILPEHLPTLAGVSRVPDEGLRLEDVERDMILQVLEKTSGNQTHAARLLGITRSALLYRMEKHGLKAR